MKVLLVTQYFWPEDFRSNDLARGLVERGHAVTVLTGLPNYPSGRIFDGYGRRGPWRETHAGIEIVRVPLVPRGRGGGPRLAVNYLSFALTATWSALRRIRGPFDIVFVFEPSPITVGIPAAVAARRFRAPILFWALDLWPESVSAAGGVRSPIVLLALDRLVRWIYTRCALVLVPSRAYAPEVARFGVSEDRIRYFPNWVETAYRPVEGAFGEGLPPLPDGLRVMFAGNIGAAQDFPAVLDAADLLKVRRDVHWLVVGDGRMAGWARGEVSRRGLDGQVHFLGRHSPERMPALFAAADALLVSLKRDPLFARTIPGKVPSYLSCGRPVLAMLDGEGARIVDEAQAGFSAPAGDPQALAAAVLKLAALPPSERARLGENGRRYAEEHFARGLLFDRLEAWFAEVAGKDGER